MWKAMGSVDTAVVQLHYPPAFCPWLWGGTAVFTLLWWKAFIALFCGLRKAVGSSFHVQGWWWSCPGRPLGVERLMPWGRVGWTSGDVDTSPRETPFGSLGWFLRETFQGAVLTAAFKTSDKSKCKCGGGANSANSGGSQTRSAQLNGLCEMTKQPLSAYVARCEINSW